MNERKILRTVAKKYGISLAQVSAEIHESIRIAYEQTPTDSITAAYQNRIPRQGNIPTPEEFIAYVAKQVKAKL